MQLVPEKIIKLWNEWEVRVLILFSLLLQIILVIFGSRRKFTAKIWTRILVWSAYLAADWVATVALGCLASSNVDSEDNSSKQSNVLQAFWAPFLLLHLGGPDTITAYSLEDNELWLRHFLGLIVQVGVAFYVFIRSWSNMALTFISIPMFITGMIKYGERTLVLRRRGADQQLQRLKTVTVLPRESLKTGANYLQVAKFLFKRFRYLFADLILSYYEREDSYSKIENMPAEDAFKLVAIELGFMYDELYTKASIVYSQFGTFFRFISLCCSISALVAFSVIIDIHAYSLTDISITFILLVGAVALEVYAFVALFFSDWTKLWFTNLRDLCLCLCASCPRQSVLADRKRWSEKMAQYNLISCHLQNVQSICIGIHKLPWVGKLLEKYLYLTWEDVNVDVKNTIYRQLLNKSNEIKGDRFSVESCKKILAHRGDNVLEKRNGLLDQFRWSISDVEFDHSLLLWHIATDLCYYSDQDVNKLDEKCRISKCLSDYLLYLLVFCPSMLPEGIGEIKYRDTNEEALRFFHEEEERRFLCWTYVVKKKKFIERGEACKALLGVKFGDEEEQIKGDRSQSVLFYGCRLAKQLQSLEQRWEIISEVLVEILTYAANKCRWKEHGQQLRKGGELLTHVRLLMVHLGLSEQYRIQKRYHDQTYIRRISNSILYILRDVVLKLLRLQFATEFHNKTVAKAILLHPKV
ncbi:hypothetical protein JRO89_XS09G0229000 [Xanthoceras sorbifolium]|uniref:DUF4220 domain-containing protein n=1 Tax=Xanthoceras sorbifolium TaxID=99658 RepID=A0ABQ8HMI3_9ROSI|nr:hypothetical protein JRO89_XS09G0229000 [Xanthoceras sorbifolium]